MSQFTVDLPIASRYPDELVAAITAEVVMAMVAAPPGPAVAGPDEKSSRRLTAIDRDLRTKLLVVCNTALKRSLEKAGAKIISKSRVASAAPIRDRIKGVDAWRVPSVVGPLALQAALGLSEKDVLDVAFPDLKRQWNDWVASAQDASLRVAATISKAPLTTVYANTSTRMTVDREAGWVQLQEALQQRASDLLESADEDVPLNGDTLVLPQIVRAAIAVAGGYLSADTGRDIVDSRPGDPSEPFGGIGTGDTVSSVLVDLGAQPTQYQWLHGLSDRPLEGHLALDGAEFNGWDSDTLLNNDDFPQDDYFFPGDHSGCQCDVVVLWSGAAADGESEDSTDDSSADESAVAASLVAAFNPDQPRDEHGRFAPGDGDSGDRGNSRVGSLPGTIAPNDPNKSVPFDQRLGRCYELSAQYQLSNPGSTLVHGTIQGAGQPPLDHAWVETKDGKVFEPASGHVMTAEEFRSEFHPAEGATYSTGQAAAEMNSTEHYGPWGSDATGSGGPTGDFERDAARVEALQASYLAEGRDTQSVYDLIDGKENKYDSEREAQHQEIIDKFTKGTGIESDRQMLVMAGVPGAGKTTFLTSEQGQQTVGVDLSKYVTVNADDVKAEMFDRGMVPSYPGLTPAESTGLVHEESSYVAKQVLATALANGQNVAYDVTLSRASQFTEAKQLAEQVGHDYKTTAVLVDTPVSTAVSRAIGRYENGGRYVPTTFIQSMADPNNPSVSKPVIAFNEIESQVDQWAVVSNQGDSPVITVGNNQGAVLVSG